MQKCKPYKGSPIVAVGSKFLCELKRQLWVLNKKSEFSVPSQSPKVDFHKDLFFNDTNGLLFAIGFGEEAKKLSEDYTRKNYDARR